jgi:hypothetical protein
MDSYGGLILFLGKCSIPFFNRNWNLTFHSCMSIIAPMVRRERPTSIIGQDGLHSISSTIKSTGTLFQFAIIITSLILPNGVLIVESAKCKLREHSSISMRPSMSHNDFGIVETLAPRSHKALHS